MSVRPARRQRLRVKAKTAPKTKPQHLKRTSRREPRTDARDRLIDAALAEFADLGFEGAATRRIAARASVNQGLLAYYFKSKEDLWEQAVQTQFQRVIDTLAERYRQLEEVDELTRLRLMIRHFIRFVAENPTLPLLMSREGHVDSARSRFLYPTYVQPIFEILSALVRSARELRPAAPLAEISAEHVFFVLIGAGTYPFCVQQEFRHLTGRDPFARESVEEWAGTIETLLLGPRQNKERARGVAVERKRGTGQV
jgi:AcrR family transcriptional regulator